MSTQIKKSDMITLTAVAISAVATALFYLFVNPNAAWWFLLIIFLIVAAGVHGGLTAQARDSKIIDKDG